MPVLDSLEAFFFFFKNPVTLNHWAVNSCQIQKVDLQVITEPEDLVQQSTDLHTQLFLFLSVCLSSSLLAEINRI